MPHFYAPLLGIEWIWHLQGSPFKQTMAWLMRCRRYEGGSCHVEAVLSALRFIYHLFPKRGCSSARCSPHSAGGSLPWFSAFFFFLGGEIARWCFNIPEKGAWMAGPWAVPGLQTVALVVQQWEYSKYGCQWRWLAAVKQRGPLVSRLLLLCVFREWLIHHEGEECWIPSTVMEQGNAADTDSNTQKSSWDVNHGLSN